MINPKEIQSPALVEVKPEYFGIFKASQVIELECWAGGRRGAYQGEILSVLPDQLVLTFDPAVYPDMSLPQGSAVTVGLVNEGSLFRGECKILSVHTTAVTKVITTRPREVSRTQLRSSYRWETLLSDCALFRASKASPGEWIEYPLVITNISIGGIRAQCPFKLPTGPEAEDFIYVCEIRLSWGLGTLTLPLHLIGADEGGTPAKPSWNYRTQFIDPPAASQDAISRYINRCQSELQAHGTALPGPQDAPAAIRETPAFLGGARVSAAGVVAPAAGRERPLAELLADLNRPARERAYHLGRAATAIARDIILSPTPENVALAAPFVGQMVDYLVKDRELFKELVRSLASTRDLYVHSVNVAIYTMALGLALGYKDTGKLPDLATGAFLHDLGKTQILETILGKETELTYAEWETVRRHPNAGRGLASRCKITSPIVLNVIQHHHEKYDGGGYPEGLVGERISIESRMVAIADGFDALSSERSWRPRFSIFKALVIMRDEMRGAYDRDLLRDFVQVLGGLLSG